MFLRAMIGTALCTGACARAPATTPAPTPREEGVVLTVENTTTQTLGVFLIEEKNHTRLGNVDPNTIARLLMKESLLQGRSLFRVYAFRGVEACPVARVLDLRFSRTPRMTVTPADTVVSGYLPADTCRQVSR